LTSADDLDELVAAVRAGAHYRHIHPELVRQVGAQELAKGRKFKEAVKATRNKLHQVGGAYQEKGIDYGRALLELEQLPPDLYDPAVQAFCRRMMEQHASTRERLPILDDFYREILSPLGPIESVLDVACGLNPLARAWMPLQPETVYYACDIYADMIAFLNRFFTQMNLPGRSLAVRPGTAGASAAGPTGAGAEDHSLPGAAGQKHRAALIRGPAGKAYPGVLPGAVAGRAQQGHGGELRGAFPGDGRRVGLAGRAV
jgi:hypothetical protein